MQQLPSPDLASILIAIQALSPSERRQLLRRLNASGLVEPDELLTDQHRLDVSPALGTNISLWRDLEGTPKTAPPIHDAVLPEEEVEAANIPVESPVVEDSVVEDSVAESNPEPIEELGEYRSPVSGKIVMGVPSDVVEDDPYAMHPVPGQAPERPIIIIFDGGSKGNPGKGYGSYALRWPGQQDQIVKLQFGDNVTNNEAEYDTLIAALEATLARLDDLGAGASTAQMTIYGDSLLVINQVKGAWKCKDSRMQLRRDRARALLADFGRWELIHHDRSNSVRVLGH
jgi:ribonuclease HI